MRCFFIAAVAKKGTISEESVLGNQGKEWCSWGQILEPERLEIDEKSQFNQKQSHWSDVSVSSLVEEVSLLLYFH